MVQGQPPNTCFQRVRICQIGHTDCPAANFIFIGWPDTAPCRADFGDAVLSLSRLIKLGMYWQYKRRIFCDHQVFRANFDPLALKFGNFFFQVPWI